MIRRYGELIRLHSFAERFDYLRLFGTVGVDTFGFDRIFNQEFYRSREWRRVRAMVIARDGGFDLGVEGYEIPGRVLVHHMNPIGVSDISAASESLLDPEFLICVSHDTHNALHYGGFPEHNVDVIERKPNDTVLWNKLS